MTKDQFQNETFYYMTFSEQEASDKAAEYNAKGVDGDTVVVVKLGDRWCLMLGVSFAFIRGLDI